MYVYDIPCNQLLLFLSLSALIPLQDGKFEVVANAAGDRVTPAVVAFHETEVVSYLFHVYFSLPGESHLKLRLTYLGKNLL